MKHSNLKNCFQVAGGAFFTSFSAVFVKLAHVSPTTAGFYRMFFAGIMLLVILIISKEKIFIGKWPLGLAFVAGIFAALDLYLWNHSIKFIGVGLSTLLVNFQIFILAAIGIFFHKEKVSFRLLVAIPMAILGLYLLVGFDWKTFKTMYKIGLYMALAAAVFYSFYTTTLRHSQQIEKAPKPMINLMLVSFFCALALGVFGLLEHTSFVIPDVKNLVWLLVYALLVQIFGWWLIISGLPHIKISIVGFLLLFQPIFSFVWDIAFFHRYTPLHQFIGLAITLLAIYLSATRER